MSRFLDRLMFFKKEVGTFSDKHGITTNESRGWERMYRNRWAHDKIVRSTHGVNCTGSCSWKIYVKKGMITWETQQTDYPRTRPDLPNHEPRGCQRGASFSWYLYSAARLKYPLIRKELLMAYRAQKKNHTDPVLAWGKVQDENRDSYVSMRGRGNFVRAPWSEVNEIIAASNIYSIVKFGPDRISGFSPIPAMSMVSYASGARYLSLIGGNCLSFYDWYCDLPPSSPQTFGEQTDVPESADWYNSSFIMAWGSNVPQTRTPDAHFFSEARYNGTKTIAITPDYSEVAKFSDHWLSPKQGTDSALAMAMGHVIIKEFYMDRKVPYFNSYVRQYTDLPFLVILKPGGKEGTFVSNRFLRSSDIIEETKSLDAKTLQWQSVVFDEKTQKPVVPNGTVGDRWIKSKKWNLELKNAHTGEDISPLLSAVDITPQNIAQVSFPYFGDTHHAKYKSTNIGNIINRKVPYRIIKGVHGEDIYVATVFDLMVAHYGVDHGLDDPNVATSYDDFLPYTPAWQEYITGVSAQDCIKIARQFAENAEITKGRSMIIVGAAINHWYNMDMTYRGMINMLMLCGCIGQSGGGWAHYVGQEKLRPLTGWLPYSFALDWQRPPRQMNGTSFFYMHTDQWRYEKVRMEDILSPTADQKKWEGETLLDANYRSEKLGWLPSAPQFNKNPLTIIKEADKQHKDPVDYVKESLSNGSLIFASEDPDAPENWPRILFVWRSNILGSSGKGHEYFLKHLLGATNGVMNEETSQHPKHIKWRDAPTEGKLDLLVTLDFRLSTTALYSDIVLPTASFYEKNDLNTSDMHPFVHPLSKAVDPVWESRSDFDIYKGIAESFSKLCKGHLGIETDLVSLPLMHDTPKEMGQPLEVEEWNKDVQSMIPGTNMPAFISVTRNYPETYKRFITLGPALDKLGNGGKGINWDTKDEIHHLGEVNGLASFNQRPLIDTAIKACDVILSLAPETNGRVAVKAWNALSNVTGREHAHLAAGKKDEHITYLDLRSQPRKIISSPTWSGIESEKVSYNAGYTNVHEYIPWRTITGRQQFYQDHRWMRDFGEEFTLYKPPVNVRTWEQVTADMKEKHVVLNFITPHQKWGIHSTYTDNLIMLTLSRGGPIVWISEIDAKAIGVEDNDWIEAVNVNGALVARAVVSQRVPEGMSLMYHAQEKIVNVPLSPTTGQRGGIHNSMTRTIIKPTHMIGGYVQQAYGFNYYGTVGSNRDEFIVVRKLTDFKWGDEEAEL